MSAEPQAAASLTAPSSQIVARAILGDLMERLLAALAVSLRVECCAVLEASGDDETFTLVAGRGVCVELLWNPGWIDRASPVSCRLAPAARAVDEEAGGADGCATAPCRGRARWLHVPIEICGGSYGLLVAARATQEAFTKEEVAFAETVASVAAVAAESHLDRAERERRALHDPLTGLPGRPLALDRLGHALSRPRRQDEATIAVLMLGVDHLGVINDSLGHSAGDELLGVIASRLAGAVRPGDTAARSGGDEFVVVCEQVDGVAAATVTAERLLAAVHQPITLKTGEQLVTASVGIAMAEGQDTPESLLRDAAAAMHRAKARGSGRYELFDVQVREHVLRRLRTKTDLCRALRHDELRVHYQPIVRTDTGQPVGVEALVRWEHPERGLLTPNEFVPTAEESGLIVELGECVLERAAQQVAHWQREVHTDLEVCVNVSGRQIAHPAFAAFVTGVIERTGIADGTLGLEITESVLMEEVDAPAAILSQLRDSNVRLILDDFGTGYSSLSYLRRFELDALKIDRSFVAGLGTEHDSAIVDAIVHMAGALGLGVIAEGIETQEQLTQLRRLGCGLAQGYLFAKPQPADKMHAYLMAHSNYGRDAARRRRERATPTQRNDKSPSRARR